MPPSRWVAILVLVGLATGCSATHIDPTTGSDGPVTHVDAMADDIALPIDSYGYTALETGQIILARELLISDCMHRLGLRLQTEPDRSSLEQSTRSRMNDFGFHGNKRRYGVTETDVAATYGYHLPSIANGATAPSAGEQKTNPSARPEVAEKLALSGAAPDGQRPTQVNEHTIPKGGCVGEATYTITRAGPLGNADLVRNIAWESFDRSLKDPKLADAVQRWSSCMKTKGYDHLSPQAASSIFDGDEKTVTSNEIATATADVACKQQTQLVTTWRDIEESYQNIKISEHAHELKEAAKDHDMCMKRVTEIIARH